MNMPETFAHPDSRGIAPKIIQYPNTHRTRKSAIVAALKIDALHELRKRLLLSLGNIPKSVPERGFQRNGCAMTADRERPFDRTWHSFGREKLGRRKERLVCRLTLVVRRFYRFVHHHAV
jgi:hypothetical protein